jgi:hypothetical protein
MWKEAALIRFKLLFHILPQGAEENVSEDIRHLGQELKFGSPEYESEIRTKFTLHLSAYPHTKYSRNISVARKPCRDMIYQ